jgi:hypothetical protein
LVEGPAGNAGLVGQSNVVPWAGKENEAAAIAKSEQRRSLRFMVIAVFP